MPTSYTTPNLKGKKGIQGEAGKDGKDGTTYTPSIGEVTTVDSTELASASVSVNTETKEAVFNFAIPKGNKGLDGKDGVQISDNETVEDKTWSSQKTSSKIAEKIDKTNILTTLDDAATDDQVYSAKLVNDELDKKANNDEVLKKTDIVDNLTSTDTDKPLSANQGKILNDTKLNKTDANKLNCVTIDNVSLKEYILTNFTEIGKTYYLIAKTTCTDLPKASNFYITVETPGLYTYKVTAKELNDSNGKYVCTYRTISSSWSDWEKVLSSSDITDTIDINSSDIKIPNVKAIFNDIIAGKEIDQTVIDKYGTEILKYPLGIWRISSDSISNKFSDLPAKASGRIEITSIISDTNKNPWDNEWSYRAYNFETYSETNYFRKLSSVDTAGVKHDTGWQRVCTTTVDNVGVTTITPVNSNITGNIEYTVKNGICYVSMKNVNSTTNTDDLSISTTMPKSSIDCGFSLIAKGSKGNIGFLYIGKNTTKLNGNFWVAGVSGNCSFSYPVAES